MSFTDYLSKGQLVELEIFAVGKSPKYSARVESVSETDLSIVLIDDDLNISAIAPGSKGLVWGKRKELKYKLNVAIDSVENSGMLRLKHLPSRSYLRVDAIIICEFKKISDEGLIEKRKRYIQNMSPESEGYLFPQTRSYSEESEATANIHPELMNEIQSIHKKLDFIIKFLGTSEEENIFNREPIEVNISGSGIQFKSQEDFQTGDYLDIKLVLPISSRVIIELIGKVVRAVTLTDKTDQAGKNVRDVAVQFETINEDDREFVIRYVFKRQRELLRAE